MQSNNKSKVVGAKQAARSNSKATSTSKSASYQQQSNIKVNRSKAMQHQQYISKGRVDNTVQLLKIKDAMQ